MLAALALCVSAQSAYADEGDRDILLGMFTSATEGGTNNVFASYDGETMYRVATVFESEEHQAYYKYHHGLACTSIIYHDGFFWALSGENRNDGMFWPMISYSKDLVHWTHPAGEALFPTVHGVTVDEYPSVAEGRDLDPSKFDVVAPEWSIAANGEIYIVFSAGYFGFRYGEWGTDQMQAYTVHVTQLSAEEGTPDEDSGYLRPKNLTFETESSAKKLGFTNYAGANYIDGQLFADDGVDYLIIKRGGTDNQLLTTTNIDDPNAWTMVNEKVSWGYEAPCLVNFNGQYRLFVDGQQDCAPLGAGVCETMSDSLAITAQWAEPIKTMFVDENNSQLVARHGSAIVLKAGTDGWKVAKDLLEAQKRHDRALMYRMYNPYSGEHLYTARGLEPGNLIMAGWQYEGVGWVAPGWSEKPVYRLYNPNEKLGDHHYTTDDAEAEAMRNAGWEDEGIGWFSASDKGVPLYRQYNPNAYGMGMTGAHNYTADIAENDNLVSIGWKAEGIAWYGVGDEDGNVEEASSEELRAASF